MRTRLLARAAVLVLAAGGLLVIPTSPASAHCEGDHGVHPDRYDGGGIAWGYQSPLRKWPHVGCDPFVVLVDGGDDIDVHCAREVSGDQNDWVWARNTIGGQAGWILESRLRVQGIVQVHGCINGNQRVPIGDG